MITEVTKYEVNGKLFDTRLDAESYEDLLERIAQARKFIRENQDSDEPGGVQNSPEDIDNFDKAFREILVRHAPDLLDKWDANKRGIIGRYLSDRGGHEGRAINSLYYSCVLCVGGDNKSYGQPYFAYQTFT